MILDEIIRKTKIDLEKKMIDFPLDLLGRTLAHNPFMPREVSKILKLQNDEINIIAEVKKASPSKGVIRENFDPISIAIDYENGGAKAFSVLTEPHFFKGNLEYITQIRRYTNTPILRKDFIIHKYQIVEALVYGADFILLIAKALTKNELKDLTEYAYRLGLEVLVEIHDKEDLIKAIFANAQIIGINHRNLETFEMDIKLCERLIPIIPNSKIIVAESGLTSNRQLRELIKMGVDSFLIGEHFMRQDNIEQAIKNIRGEYANA